MSETEALALLRSMADKNQVLKSLIGQGYHETHTPYVILRNMLENPGWYTAYTPYQAEISQGRLEMLLNYQTLVTELTGMEMVQTRRPARYRPSRGRADSVVASMACELYAVAATPFPSAAALGTPNRVENRKETTHDVARPLSLERRPTPPSSTRPRPPRKPCPCASRCRKTARRRPR